MKPSEAAAYLRMTVGSLAQARYKGDGPVYLNPTKKTILYTRAALNEWLLASESTGTAVAA